MKKIAITLLSATALGILSALLRGYELAFGFDPVSGLPTGLSWIVPLLLVLGVALGVLAFFATREKCEPKAEKSTVFTGAALWGCAVMAALSLYGALKNPTGEVLTYLLAGASALNAVAFAILGVKNLSKNDSPIYSAVAFLPVVWAALAVIMIFRERVSQPIAEHFVFLLFAFLCILLFTYGQNGYAYGINRIRLVSIVGVMGVFFSVIELVAPLAASLFSVEYMPVFDFKVILPLLAYVIYMPAAVIKINRNENKV